MALNIGELFGSLSWNHDKKGADEFDRRYDEAQAKARKKIEAQLGAAVDDKAFAKYHESLDRAARRAKERAAFQTVLGADFDPKGFNAYQRALGQAERDAKRASSPGGGFGELNKAMGDFNRQATFARNIVGQIKWPALITGAGLAAQAVSTLTAGATALGAALAPIGGAAAAYPALGSAAAQGLGTWKIATQGLGQAVGGLNEKLDTSSKAFKALSPEAQQFAKHLDSLKPSVREIQQSAQRGLFPGLDKGLTDASKNLPIFNRIAGDTAKVIGDLADEAGRMLGSKAWGRDFETQGQRNVKWIGQAGEGGLHLANALRNVTLAAGPLVDWMVRGVVNGTKLVDTFTAQARESGKLAGFFHETQVEMSRVVRIGGDLAAAFFNIARAGKPLGDDILVSLVKSAQAFRDWTDSARGQNSIARYFREARPGIFEAGRLIRDLVRDFVNLGRGNQIAPLLRQIRTQMLPALVSMVDQTTRAFGPALINAITQIVRLLANFAGSSGPLTETVKLIGTMAEGLNKLFARSTALKSAMINIVAIGGLVKAFQIAGAISGVTRLIGLLKTARTAAAGTAVAGTAGAGAAGAAARTGARGVAAGVGAGIAGAIPTAAVTAGSVVLLNVIKDANKHTREWSTALDVVRRRAADLARRSNFAGLDELSRGIAASGKAAGLSSREIKALQDTVGRFSRQADRDFGGVGSAVSQARKHFADFRRTGSNDLHGIHVATQENMHFIKRTLGEDSAAGKEALARNFRAARTAVRQAMQDGKISVRDGLKEIQSLMRKELAAYGITGKTASAIIKHGNIKPETPSNPGTGKARGGFVGKKAGGGFFGDRGQRGQDTIHALVGEGEAILNHHQQNVVEGLLGPGFLDWLFANVRRPHFAAMGGKIKRFAAGGIAGAVAAANQLDRAHFPYHWGGGHQGTPAPFGPMDCSGAVSYVLQHAGINIPTMVSGQLASAGKPGTGAITVFANPTHTFMRIGGRYFGTSGQNPGGGAGWFNDPGAGYKARFAQRAFAGGAGGGIGGFSSITAPRTGVPGALGAIVQGALDATTRGANQRADQLIGSMGLGTGDPGDPGPVARGSFSFDRLRSLWIRAGGDPARAALMAHIAQAESGGDPNAHNPSGATGLWQILGAVLPGNLTNPLVNARNAVAKLRSQGLGAWAASRSAWGQFASRGGRIQRFARGKPGKRRHPIVSPRGKVTHTAQPTSRPGHPALATKRLAGIQTTRIAEYDGLTATVDDLEKAYGQQERVYNLTDDVLVDPDTGQVNLDAVEARAAEIQGLINLRNRILDAQQKMQAVLERIVKTYKTIIGRLRASLRYTSRKGKGPKQREGIKGQISQYEEDLKTYQDNLHELRVSTLPDTRLDIAELTAERAAVFGTSPSSTGATDTGAADTTGDATGTDTTAAPPTALDIAAGVQAALAEYKSQQSDLIRNFGSNAVTQRAAFAPGGVLSGTPDLEGAALGALRGFGGGSNLAGSLGAGRGGPIVVVQDGGSFAHFATAPESAPTFVSQMRFAVENGTGG